MLNNKIISWREHLSWFNSLSERDDRGFLLFSVNDRPLGAATFKDLDHDAKTCCWGFYLGEEKRPKGTGLLLGYYALEYIFAEGVEKIKSQVIEHNLVSIAFHKRLFFEKKGVSGEKIKRDGCLYNVVLFELDKTVWLEQGEYIKAAALTKIERGF
jgi:RimJ/RimL family protein N-acetyltransferase